MLCSTVLRKCRLRARKADLLVEILTHVLKEFAHLLCSNLWARLRSKPIVPNETLRIIQDVQHSRWSLGSTSSGEPLMHVSFRGHVTDISGSPNKVLRAEIPKPLTHAVLVLLCNKNDARRSQILNPHECTELSASFSVQPVAGKNKKPWQTALVFIDQYGNRHKIRNCVFNSV